MKNDAHTDDLQRGHLYVDPTIAATKTGRKTSAPEQIERSLKAQADAVPPETPVASLYPKGITLPYDAPYPGAVQDELDWRSIDGFEGYYEVSSHGDVRSLDRTIEHVLDGVSHKRTMKGKMLIASSDSRGAKRVRLSKDGVASTFQVHRLVADAFLPSPPGPIGSGAGQYQLDHEDGDPSNNTTSNLVWKTKEEHDADTTQRGQKVRGEDHGMSKLTDSEVVDLRRRAANGERQKELAEEYGISSGYCSTLVNGKSRTKRTNWVGPTIGPSVPYGPPYPGAVQDEMQWAITKHLDEAARYLTGVETTVEGPHGPSVFAIDSLVAFDTETDGERRVAIECESTRTLRDHDRRLRRDANLLASGAVDVVYRLRGGDLLDRMDDVLYAMSRWDPAMFSERGRINLTTLASPEAKGVAVLPEQPSVLVPYEARRTESLWHAANDQTPYILVRRLAGDVPSVWAPYATHDTTSPRPPIRSGS